MPAPPGPGCLGEGAGGDRLLSSPSLSELLAAIAELEPLEATSARFPGFGREAIAARLFEAAQKLAAATGEATPPPRARAAATLELFVREPESGAPAAPAPTPLMAPTPVMAPTPPVAPAAGPAARGVVYAWSDGASRGNPGPASVGVVLRDPGGAVLATVAEAIGRRTNNFAEYEAVRHALLAAKALGAKAVRLHADSELVVKQLSGVYQVKNADLRPLFEAVKRLERDFPDGVRYQHVRRELNRDADALANEALDRG